MSEKIQNIDSVLTFIFLKKLMTPIVKTEAYKIGIVDELGKKIKSPETKEEKNSYTLLDKTIFKLKRLLGARLTQLHAFLYLQTLNSDTMYNKLIATSGVESKTEIKRIAKDLQRLAESHNCSITDLLNVVISEEIVKNQNLI